MVPLLERYDAAPGGCGGWFEQFHEVEEIKEGSCCECPFYVLYGDFRGA